MPLNNLAKNQGQYFVANSNLSEYGVLGFEYGYSLVNPKHLVLWEAQYGDFANGAQIIFDQFMASSESKWRRQSGIVVLLPYGYEGQGPEHSSARIERFLQLAAEDNIQVTYPTTPTSYFYLLRRQIHSKLRKPLIVMTPKATLRNKLVVSNLADFDQQTYFQPILDEVDKEIKSSIVRKVIFCTGKVYYDLLATRQKRNIKDTVIIRLEQLYPFRDDRAVSVISQYNKVIKFIWCQKEPKNMGAWHFINSYLNRCLQKIGINNQFRYVNRDPAASPTTGYWHLHIIQQEKLVMEALIK